MGGRGEGRKRREGGIGTDKPWRSACEHLNSALKGGGEFTKSLHKMLKGKLPLMMELECLCACDVRNFRYHQKLVKVVAAS